MELLKTIKPRWAQSTAWISKVMHGGKVCLMRCLSLQHLLLWTYCTWELWHPWATICTNCPLTVGSIMPSFTMQSKAIINRFHFSLLQMCTLFSHFPLPEIIHTLSRTKVNATKTKKKSHHSSFWKLEYFNCFKNLIAFLLEFCIWSGFCATIKEWTN